MPARPEPADSPCVRTNLASPVITPSSERAFLIHAVQLDRVPVAVFPITAGVFFAIGRYSQRGAATWMFAASLFFYGWWNPPYVALLLASIAFNFSGGRALAQGGDLGSSRRRPPGRGTASVNGDWSRCVSLLSRR